MKGMPTKPGAGGKPQPYGKGGKYTKNGGSGSWDPPNGANPHVRVEDRKMLLARQGYTQRDLEVSGEGLRMAMDGAESPRIRVGYHVLGKVIEDGRFKTQHDTGTSNGMLSPTVRDKHEADMFEVERSRPIYGYVKTRSVGDTYNSQGQYGEIAVVLKPEVNSRTTVTYGDSLTPGDAPAPMPFNQVADGDTVRLAMAATALAHGRPSYVEAQIHGPVTLDDIAYVEVPPVISVWDDRKREYKIHYAKTIQAKYPQLEFRVLDDETAATHHFAALSVETLAARVLSP